MGRPKKTLTKKEWASVDYMCMIHCTGEEIAGVMGMDYDTLNRICKEDRQMSISEYIKNHQTNGKMSLRRAQWKLAESGNATMQIWLGKQWLGQSDKIETTITTVDEKTRMAVDELVEELSDDEGTSDTDIIEDTV